MPDSKAASSRKALPDIRTPSSGRMSGTGSGRLEGTSGTQNRKEEHGERKQHYICADRAAGAFYGPYQQDGRGKVHLPGAHLSGAEGHTGKHLLETHPGLGGGSGAYHEAHQVGVPGCHLSVFTTQFGLGVKFIIN